MRERGGYVVEPGVGDLVSQLVQETGDLVKLEVARLRAEMIEKSAVGIATGVSGAIVAAVGFVVLQAIAVGAIIGFGIVLGSYVAGAFVAAAALLVFGLILFAALRAPVRHMVAKKMGTLPAPPELPQPTTAGALPERTSHPEGVRH